MNISRRSRLGAVVAAIAILAAACGDDDESTTTQAPAPVETVAPAGTSAPLDTGAPADSAAPVSTGAPADTATTEEEVSTSELPYTGQPLAAVPAKKHIVWLQCAVQDACEVIGDGLQQAAEVLGWDFDRVSYDPNPESINAAFNEALDMKPDGIGISGEPHDRWDLGLKRACEMGVPIFTGSVVDEFTGACPDGNGIVGLVSAVKQYDAASNQIAKYIADNGPDDAKVQVFTVEDFPILRGEVDALKSNLAALCPGCSIEIINQQVSDIAVNTPANVVSAVQGDPDADFAYFTFGSLSLGVTAALQEAGLLDQVGVLGVAGVPENFQNLRDGTNLAWATWSTTILGWQYIDSFARYFEDVEGWAPVDVSVPFDLLTQDNAPEGDSVLIPPDYPEQYQALWGVD